jgi:hypothetical protein
MDIAEAVEIAQSCLDGETTALAASRSLSRLVGPPNPIWDEMGGAHGPLSAFYIAADEADRVYFLDQDIERWHPHVRERKRTELVEAEANATPHVREACRALIAHAGRNGNGFRKS